MKSFLTYLTFLASSGGGSGSISDITTLGTSLVTWIVSTMTTLIGFITSNDVMMVLFVMVIISFAIGVMRRLWRTARG